MIPKLTLMCGLARIGKSSWIEKHKKDAIVVSPDEIRREIFGHQFHSFANKFVFAITEAMVLLLLKQNKNVIVDATHLTESVRQQWYPVFKATGAETTVVWVYASRDKFKNAQIAVERSLKSSEDKKVPVTTIDSMAVSFEEPTKGSWYSIIEVENK